MGRVNIIFIVAAAITSVFGIYGVYSFRDINQEVKVQQQVKDNNMEDFSRLRTDEQRQSYLDNLLEELNLPEGF